jgi:hypothetical protein
VDNIKINLREIVWGGMDWIGLAQDKDKWRALAKAAMNLRFPQNAGKLIQISLIGSSVTITCSFNSRDHDTGMTKWPLLDV